MRLFASQRDSQCFLRLLANWGLGLAGLPLAVVDDDEERSPLPALPLTNTSPAVELR
jgi:hypothetical protein